MWSTVKQFFYYSRLRKNCPSFGDGCDLQTTEHCYSCSSFYFFIVSFSIFHGYTLAHKYFTAPSKWKRRVLISSKNPDMSSTTGIEMWFDIRINSIYKIATKFGPKLRSRQQYSTIGPKQPFRHTKVMLFTYVYKITCSTSTVVLAVPRLLNRQIAENPGGPAAVRPLLAANERGRAG